MLSRQLFTELTNRSLRGLHWNFRFDLPDGHPYTPETFASEPSCPLPDRQKRRYIASCCQWIYDRAPGERHDRLETRLLAGIQKQVLQPEVIDYTLTAFEEELTRQMQGMSGQMDEHRNRQAQLQAEIEQYTRALADGYSPAISAAIMMRERELSEVSRRLVSGGRGSIQAEISELRTFVHSRLADVRKLLCADVPRARTELARHVDRIVIRPVEVAGQRYYMATGGWDLLGRELGPQDAAPPVLEMVAGARFELATFGL